MSRRRRKSKDSNSYGPLSTRADHDLLSLTRQVPEAFGVFYERHAEAVLAYICRRITEPKIALDLTAEVFAAALTARPRYQPEIGSARAWLYGIADEKLAANGRHDKLVLSARRKLGIPEFDFGDEALKRVDAVIDGADVRKRGA